MGFSDLGVLREVEEEEEEEEEDVPALRALNVSRMKGHVTHFKRRRVVWRAGTVGKPDAWAIWRGLWEVFCWQVWRKSVRCRGGKERFLHKGKEATGRFMLGQCQNIW